MAANLQHLAPPRVSSGWKKKRGEIPASISKPLVTPSLYWSAAHQINSSGTDSREPPTAAICPPTAAIRQFGFCCWQQMTETFTIFLFFQIKIAAGFAISRNDFHSKLTFFFIWSAEMRSESFCCEFFFCPQFRFRVSFYSADASTGMDDSLIFLFFFFCNFFQKLSVHLSRIIQVGRNEDQRRSAIPPVEWIKMNVFDVKKREEGCKRSTNPAAPSEKLPPNPHTQSSVDWLGFEWARLTHADSSRWHASPVWRVRTPLKDLNLDLAGFWPPLVPWQPVQILGRLSTISTILIGRTWSPLSK